MCYLEVEHIAIQLDDIYSRVVILNTVRSFNNTLIIQQIDEVNIVTNLLSEVIQTFVIVDPQSNIPGLIILPTIILSGEDVALISDSHLWLIGKSFGASCPLHYWYTFRGPVNLPDDGVDVT